MGVKGQETKGRHWIPKATDKKRGERPALLMYYTPTYLYTAPGSTGERRRQISCRLIIWKQKQALNQGWGYKIEAESSSKTFLPWANSCRLWLSAKLSLADDEEGPACGCPEQFFTAGPDFPKGRLEDSSWWRWPEWLAGYHSQYCAVQTGSPQRSKTWLPGSVGVGEGAVGRRDTSNFCAHHHHSSSEERISI